MTSTSNGHGYAVEDYSGFAKFMHWLVAACVLVMIPVGFVMGSLPAGLAQDAGYNLHRSFGVLLLVLMLIRLGYRLMNGVPSPEPTLSPMQRIVSHIVHLALYALLIAQSLIGWVATSAYGAQIWVFGLFVMPPAVEKDEALANPLFAAHEVIAFTISGLLLLHIGAALHHYFVRQDRVLQRMLPGGAST